MVQPSISRAFTILALCIPASALAGPVATVPWNGHPGAITFTFDDGLASQVTNVFPAFASRSCAATFFVYNANSFASNRPAWVAAAQAGQEITNHTVTHPDLTSLDSAHIETEVSGWASALRAANALFASRTMAYPYCAANALVNRISGQTHFIARSCGGTAVLNYRIAPEWMQMPARSISDNVSIAQAHAGIDQAVRDTAWLITLNHDIAGDVISIPADSLNHLLDHAAAKNLWISTFERVGAYWRASFVMNAAVPTANADGWTCTWTSPHTKMPPAVLLKIRLDRAVFPRPITVFQDAGAIDSASDGSYAIDFMKLQLNIARGTAKAINTPKPGQSFKLQMRINPNRSTLSIRGVKPGRYHCTIYSLKGQRLNGMHSTPNIMAAQR
jgi:peptidoglycan/xylan/chitin deacetylase (PgdA/CDA1 family)